MSECVCPHIVFCDGGGLFDHAENHLCVAHVPLRQGQLFSGTKSQRVQIGTKVMSCLQDTFDDTCQASQHLTTASVWASVHEPERMTSTGPRAM